MLDIETDEESQSIRKQIIKKGIEFLESNNFKFGILTWESARRNGEDLPDMQSINRYFGNWAAFNSVVRKTYSDPGLDWNPTEQDLKGFSPTAMPKSELKTRPWKPKDSLETKVSPTETRTDISAVPVERPIPLEIIADVQVTLPLPVKAPEIVPVADTIDTINTKKSYAGTDIKKRSSDKNITRPILVIGVGAAAALLAIYMGTGISKIKKEVSLPDNPVKPTDVQTTAPVIQNDVLKELGLQAAPIKVAEKDPKIVSPDEDNMIIPEVYRGVVSRIKKSRPKSLVPEYNLSPDAKSIISVQGLLNTAFYEGTREYADAKETAPWNGGSNSADQTRFAERWLKEYVGLDLEELASQRDAEFTEDFIRVKEDRTPDYRDNLERSPSRPANTDSYDTKIENTGSEVKKDKAA